MSLLGDLKELDRDLYQVNEDRLTFMSAGFLNKAKTLLSKMITDNEKAIDDDLAHSLYPADESRTEDR